MISVYVLTLVYLAARRAVTNCQDLLAEIAVKSPYLTFPVCVCAHWIAFPVCLGQSVCFECSQVTPGGTTLSFVVANRETAPTPSGEIERANISIACEGATGNSPEMFQKFLFFFFFFQRWVSTLIGFRRKFRSHHPIRGENQIVATTFKCILFIGVRLGWKKKHHPEKRSIEILSCREIYFFLIGMLFFSFCKREILQELISSKSSRSGWKVTKHAGRQHVLGRTFSFWRGTRKRRMLDQVWRAICSTTACYFHAIIETLHVSKKWTDQIVCGMACRTAVESHRCCFVRHPHRFARRLVCRVWDFHCQSFVLLKTK